jgi:hypothetical protein
MGSSDAFFVGVDKNNPTSGATADMNADGQVKSSAFLTVQSFTNFAAATGAISAAWQALKALNSSFDSAIAPFLLSVAWLATCLITSYQAGAAGDKKASFWMSSVFLGLMNCLTLFAAVLGASVVAPSSP